MTNTESFKLAKRWRLLFAQERDIEFTKGLLAHETRNAYPAGKAGDERFHKWFETEFGFARGKSIQLLELASLHAIVPDERTWMACGGFKKIRPLRHVGLADRTAIIEIVRATGRSVLSVTRERNLLTRKPDIAPAKVATRLSPEALDARVLAEFVLANVARVSISASIRKIVERYVPAKIRAVA